MPTGREDSVTRNRPAPVAPQGQPSAKERLAIQRVSMPERNPSARATDFQEVNLGLDEAADILEAQRCLQCKHRPCVAGCPLPGIRLLPVWPPPESTSTSS